MGEFAFEGAPVLLAGKRGRAGFFEEGGIFAAQPVDLVTGFGECHVAASESRQDLADADRRGGLLQLALEAFLEAEQGFEVLVGEVAADEHLGVLGADPVDPPVPLNEAHRVPRQVVVDDVPGLLEVHAFGQHIGGDKQVIQVLGMLPAGGAGSEPGERLCPAALVRAGRGGDPVPVGGQAVISFDGGAVPAWRGARRCRRSRRR